MVKSNAEALNEDKDSLRHSLIARGYNSFIEYEELIQIGSTIFGSSQVVGLFGLDPKELFDRNIRIYARTGIEALYDFKAIPAGLCLASVIEDKYPDKEVVAIDPFLGSGNALFTMAKYAKACDLFGIDKNPLVYELAQNNFAKLNIKAKLFCDDYENMVHLVRPFERMNHSNELFVIGIAPPWGDAFDFVNGLHLDRTKPSHRHLIETYTNQLKNLSVLFFIPLPEKVDEQSLNEILSLSSFYRIFDKGTKTALLILIPKPLI